MSRKIYDEDLRLNLILNGQGLATGSKLMVAELGKLEQEFIRNEQRAKELAMQITKLAKTKNYDRQVMQGLEAEYKQVTLAMRANQGAINELRNKIGLAGMTVQQLRNHLNALKVQLYNMPGSAGLPMFKALQAEIAATETRLRMLTTGASRLAQAWERIEKAANRAGTIMGWAMVVIYGITRVVGAVITRMKELEDLVGNVRKNTNLFVGEVWEMKDAFDQWDTRTKTDDLLKLAVVAGKLGVEGKVGIMEFVDSANKIQIALGDDLNTPVEETVNSIAKLTNAFRTIDEIDEKTGEKFTLGAAMLRTGDVLNQLAKSSAASAGTILQYMTRLSGVSELANFSIAQIGGLASVLDAVHVPAELGSTALQKIMLQMGNPKKVNDFAEAMGLVANETGSAAVQYKELLNNDPNTVLIGLMQRFIASKDGLTELNQGLTQFGVRGQRMSAVVGLLAQNLDVLQQQQSIGAKAWKDGTSVMQEYMIMNNNFTAEVLKQQKIIRAQTDYMDRKAEPAVVALVTAWASFVKWIREAGDWIGRNWGLIKILTAAYIALNIPTLYRIGLLITETAIEKAHIIVVMAKVFWLKVTNVWLLILILTHRQLSTEQLVQTSRVNALRVAYIAMQRGVRAAWLEMRTLMAVGAGFGVVLSATVIAVAALAAAFYFLVFRKKELTEAQKADQELHGKIISDYYAEKGQLDIITERLKDKNISEEERISLLKQIKEQYGEYLPLLEKEGLSVADVTGHYDELVAAMGRKITRKNLMEAAGINSSKLQEAERNIAETTDKISQLSEKLNHLGSWEAPELGVGETMTKLNSDLVKYKAQRQDFLVYNQKYLRDLAKLTPSQMPMVNSVEGISGEMAKENARIKNLNADNEALAVTSMGSGMYAEAVKAQIGKNNQEIKALNISYRELEAKLKQVKVLNTMLEDMKKGEAPFNERQGDRKNAEAGENVDLSKDFALGQKSEEAFEKGKKEIKLKYLKEEIADRDQTGRNEGPEKEKYLALWQEYWDLLGDKEKKGAGANKAALKEIEDSNVLFAAKQLALAKSYRAGEIGDLQDFEEQKANIEKQKDDALLEILTKYNLKRSDIINDQAENEIAINDEEAKNQISDNNTKAAEARNQAQAEYEKGTIKGKENLKGILLKIEEDRLAEELRIYKEHNLNIAGVLKKQGDLLVKQKDNDAAKSKEVMDQITKSADGWESTEKQKLQKRFIDDLAFREHYDDELMKLGLARLIFEKALMEQQLNSGKLTIDQQKEMTVQLAALTTKILDLQVSVIKGGTKSADSNTKDLNKELGQRKSYFAKVALLKSAEREFEKDDAKTLEQKEAYRDATKMSIEELSMAETIAFAESTAMAVENANTVEESAVAVLNAIRSKIAAYLAESVAAAIAKEIGSKGIFGIITGAIAAAAVMTLFNTLIPKFELTRSGGIGTKSFGKTSQKAEGSYPVIGADDGRMYHAVQGGTPVTGVYNRPTLLNMSDGQNLVGERAPELVVDGNTFRRIQLNAPELIQDIYAYAGKGASAPGFGSAQPPGSGGLSNRASAPLINRIGQKAEGSYPDVSGGSAQPAGIYRDAELLAAIRELNVQLKSGIRAKATIAKYGRNGLDEAMDDIVRFKAKVYRD